jgi:hypothetical protein
MCDGANAADLQLRMNDTPSSKTEFDKFLAARQQKPDSAEAIKQLFQDFLRWSRGH